MCGVQSYYICCEYSDGKIRLRIWLVTKFYFCTVVHLQLLCLAACGGVLSTASAARLVTDAGGDIRAAIHGAQLAVLHHNTSQQVSYSALLLVRLLGRTGFSVDEFGYHFRSQRRFFQTITIVRIIISNLPYINHKKM